MRYSIYLAIFLLSACSSVSTPDSHYYRLSSVEITNKLISIDNVFKVSPFKAEGLLNTNNLLYIDKSRPNELKQFHYHQWHASLSSVVTENFIEFISKRTSARIVEYDYKSFDGYLIQPSIKTMEIQYADSSASLVLHIEFIVKQKGKVIMAKTFKASKISPTKDIYQLVSHYNELLQEIFTKLVEEISLL